MAETYCGKNCLECGQKEVLKCPGCKSGPGMRFEGDCDLAKCCADKGHEDCSSCSFSVGCRTLRGREYIPEYRQRRMEAEKIRQEAIAKRAPVLGKWLWVLFWLIIPGSVASLLTNENITGAVSALYISGLVLRVICSAVSGIILLRLTSEEDRYRTAGICALIVGVASVLAACISDVVKEQAWSLVISFPAAIVGMVGEYNEFTAHSIVLTGLDNALSDQWMSLWKWYVGSYCALLGSVLMIVISPVLGLLVVTAAAIGLIITSILKLVYLYRTARIFRNFRAA